MKKISWTYLLLGCLLLTGCSVGMAMSGNHSPDIGAIKVGITRGEAELHLGSPAKSVTLESGRTDIYEYEVGNEPSAGRAVFHALMDLLTYGAWELIGTPVEGFMGDKRQIEITYDNDDRVTKLRSLRATAPTALSGG